MSWCRFWGANSVWDSLSFLNLQVYISCLVFSHYIFEYFINLIFILTFQDSNDRNPSSLVIIPEIPKSLVFFVLFFFKIFSLLFRFSISYYSFFSSLILSSIPPILLLNTFADLLFGDYIFQFWNFHLLLHYTAYFFAETIFHLFQISF